MSKIFYFSLMMGLAGLLAAGCTSIKSYARSETRFCDCLSGVLAPADEFCTEWSRAATEKAEIMDKRMKRLLKFNPQRALKLQAQLDTIRLERQRCLEALQR